MHDRSRVREVFAEATALPRKTDIMIAPPAKLTKAATKGLPAATATRPFTACCGAISTPARKASAAYRAVPGTPLSRSEIPIATATTASTEAMTKCAAESGISCDSRVA